MLYKEISRRLVDKECQYWFVWRQTNVSGKWVPRIRLCSIHHLLWTFDCFRNKECRGFHGMSMRTYLVILVPNNIYILCPKCLSFQYLTYRWTDLPILEIFWYQVCGLCTSVYRKYPVFCLIQDLWLGGKQTVSIHFRSNIEEAFC